jgi:CelD/BcsL family acetyltransferase involved in cellulose biosynthesis
MLKIEKITTTEGLRALEPVWNPLLSRSAGNTIGLTWEWLSTWWEVFERDRDLCVLVVRDGPEVIGIAPLLKRTIQYYGLFQYRRIEFLGSGEDEADEICTEYLDFIILRGREEEVLRCMFGYLHGEEGFDEMLLTSISGTSANLPIVQALAAAEGTVATTTSDGIAIFRELPASWEGFLSSLSRDFRKKLLRDLRTFENEGGELLEIESEESFTTHFPTLIELHQSRWRAQGEPGVFASERFRAFHTRVAARLLPKRWVKLFVMKVAGIPIAALYDFVYAGKLYYYQSGFRTEASKLASPGMLIRTLGIRSAIEHGLTECDFLKGQPGSYKFRWGGKTRPIVQLRIARVNSKETVFNAAAAVVAGLRHVKRVLTRSAAM